MPAIRSANPKLTPKQAQFAHLYLELGNGAAAYRGAYNAEEMTSGQVAHEAYMLKNAPHIANIIKGLREKLAERLNVTIESLTQELEWARNLAFEERNPSAAVGASVAKGKLHGYFKEQVDHTGTVQIANVELLQKLTPEERAEIRAILVGAATREAAQAQGVGVKTIEGDAQAVVDGDNTE